MKFGIPSPAAVLHANAMNHVFRTYGSDAQIVALGHSQGGQIIDCLRSMISPRLLKQQVSTITFGSATMNSKKYFSSCINYVSNNDAVPILADPIGMFSSLLNSNIRVEFLQSNIVPFDHSFMDETYYSQLKKIGRAFQKQYLEGNGGM